MSPPDQPGTEDLGPLKRGSSIKGNDWHDWFSWFARGAARICGTPQAFLCAFAIIILWGISGPLFGFSDTWQLIINTGTTIVTFLMVFLIQNSQNRDSMAFQIKLAEIIIALRGAENRIAIAEEMSDDDLERLHQEYKQCADSALDVLKSRRSPARHTAQGARKSAREAS